MDKTVPKAAALLLDFIGDTEVARPVPEAYRVIFGHNHTKLDKQITDMTIGELLAAQVEFTRRFRSSASGRYQFMRKTLQGLVKELGLNHTTKFSPNLQDRLAYHLLKRRGYDRYMSGAMSMTNFGKQLAMEWASFPVLADTSGAHGYVKRGQSYYAGDALNKSLIKPEAVEEVLKKMQLGLTDYPVEPVPQEEPEPEGFWAWLGRLFSRIFGRRTS